MAYSDYQLEIYLQGLSGVLPSLPMSFAELEAKARAAMSPGMWSYVAGGSGDERTQRANVTAFEHWGLMPRMFVGAKERDLTDRAVRHDAAVAGCHGADRCHRHCARRTGTATWPRRRAAARTGVPMFASTLSADPMEDVAAEFGRHPRLFPALHPDRPRPGRQPRAPRARQRATRASWSPSTPGFPAGGRATSAHRTSRSCAGSAWPTTPATRSSATSCHRHRRRTRRAR